MDKVLFASKKARVVPSASTEIVNLDSDDEETEGQKPLYPFQSSLVQQQKNQEDALPVTPQFTFEDIDLGKGKEMSCAIKDMVVISASRYVEEQTRRDEVIAIENGVVSDKGVYAGQTRAEKILAIENGAVNDKGVYVGVEDDVSDNDSESADEDLGNVWNEMAIGIMCSKVAVAHTIGHVAATVSMSKVAVSFTHIIKSGQSSGKSLVIENIVGRDFLPRGSGNMAKDL